MPKTRTYVLHLCMLGLAASDEGRSGFVNASVRAVTNARQFGTRMPARCTGTHRHTRAGANNASEKMEHSGVVRAMVEQLRDEQELTLWDQKAQMDEKMIQEMVYYKFDKILKKKNNSCAK